MSGSVIILSNHNFHNRQIIWLMLNWHCYLALYVVYVYMCICASDEDDYERKERQKKSKSLQIFILWKEKIRNIEVPSLKI